MTRISKLIKPRAIYLITTHAEGVNDVATFSFVMPVSFSPPILCFSVAPQRYTYELIKKNGECVVNAVTSEMEEMMWYCGTHTGRKEDKFKNANIEVEESEEVKALRIKESPIQLECKVKEMVEAGDHIIIICEVVKEHVKKENYEALLHVSGSEVVKCNV